MSGLIQDVRYAIRQVGKNPGLTVLAVLTLALGIGANTAIFGLFDQVLLRSLPVRDPDRLVLLKYSGSNKGHISSRADDKTYFSYPMYRDLRDRNSVFSGVIATDWTQAGLQWRNQPELVATELVSGNYFEVLGVQPALGRLLVTSDDTKPDANPVAVLSFSYWRRRFDSDLSILNQTIMVNSHPFTIIGVTRSGFHSVVMGDNPDLFVPMTMKSQVIPGGRDLEDRRSSWLNIVARLKPGISREQAEAGINPLWSSIRADELKQIENGTESFRENFVAKSHLSLLDGRKGFSPLRSDLQTPLLILMAMVGLVALMACANVGGLLLVRAAGRLREMSVRYALGANRTRVIQQLLVEGLLLGLAGGILGPLLALRISVVLINMLWGANGMELPFSSHLDLRILLFNFTLAVSASLFFGLAPALQFWRPNLIPALKQQTISGGGPLRFRRILVGVQVGLSLLLLVGAGLFMRTLHRLKALDVGFATDHLVTFNIDPTLAGYQPTQEVGVYSRVLGILTALPGVRSAAGTNDSELANDNWSSNITIAGYSAKEDEDMNVENPSVSPGYFSSMGMPLLAGRELSDADRAGTQRVAVVNESFARHFFGGPQQALQHYFADGAGKTKPDVEIVGVVKDAKHTGVRQQVNRTVFSPYLQDPAPNTMTFYVRTWQTPESAEATIRQAVRTLDSKLVLDTFRTMQEQINDNLTTERVVAFLAESFGALAALMAAVGLYGVLAYSTVQRTSEIGIRMALGASRASVIRMVLAEVLWLTGIAIAVALPASLLLGMAVRKQLFGISSSDPLTLCLATLVILVVAIASALLPAWRAAKSEPLVALRYE
jgi:putative ABC transport system permease protein